MSEMVDSPRGQTHAGRSASQDPGTFYSAGGFHLRREIGEIAAAQHTINFVVQRFNVVAGDGAVRGAFIVFTTPFGPASVHVEQAEVVGLEGVGIRRERGSRRRDACRRRIGPLGWVT